MVLSATSCGEKDNVNTNTYTLTGKIILNNLPEKDVEVSVDGKLNWKTLTDSNGNFELNNVSEGEHRLDIYKSFDNGVYSQKSEEIAVYENTDFASVLLPSPLTLSPAFNITSNEIGLKWSKANPEDFYEYKLYRKEDEGIDENTGELIYVGTSINDTIHTDTDLFPEKEYYYRVFLRNQFGNLGGSNIVSGTTLQEELIPDGSFELIDSNTNYWNIERNSIINKVTDSIAKIGNSCLYNKNPLSYVDGQINTMTVMELKTPIGIETNRNYEISGWMRAMGEQGDLLQSVWIMVFQGNSTVSIVDMGINSNVSQNFIIGDTGWVYKSKIFSVTNNTPVRIEILMPFQHVWIDGLKLTPL